MNECKICANADNEYCFACDNGNQFKPMTNADRIRAMSDEELADYMGTRGCPSAGIYNSCIATTAHECTVCWLDWLNAPVEVDNE